MSSGTVGAAVEGWLAGIPSVAVSTGTVSDWHAFRDAAHSPDSTGDWERLAEVATDIVVDVVRSDVFGHADVVSVNLPFEARPSTPRRVTAVARVRYHRLFAADGDGRFTHDYGGGYEHVEEVVDTDIDAAHEGVVSITPLRLPEAAELPDHVRMSLER